MDIAEIVSKKAELIKLKKAATKFTDGWGTPLTTKVVSAFKANDTVDVIDKTIVGNTYYWMDSHDDVHVKSCFSKSIKENKRVFHLHDHEFKVSSQVGKLQKVYEEKLPWSVFGVDKDGETEALLGDSKIEKEMNPLIFKSYKNGEIDQHSVGMQYVKIELAVNDEEYEEEFKVWNEVFPLIGNPELAEEKGYFWAVKEAKLIEISAVLMGSNSLTPTLEDKSEPGQPTPNTAAAKALQSNQFFNNLI